MQTFSFGAVMADLGAVLRVRWALLLALVAAALLVEFFVFQSEFGPMAALVRASGGYGVVAMGLLRLLLEAFYLGFITHLTLTTPEPARPATAAAARAAVDAMPRLLLIGFLLWLPRAVLEGPFRMAAAMYAMPEVGWAETLLSTVVIGVLEGLLGAYLLASRAVAVWEDLSPTATVRRALTLTLGHGWLAVALFVLGTLPVLALEIGVWAAWFLEAYEGEPTWYYDAGLWLGWPAMAASAVFFALCFLELRRIVDPPPIEETAEVFE